jgi:SAM-dependent methyltransferase
MNGWDDPRTPHYYESFCREHSRYTRANAELIAHSRIEPGLHVLDIAAGTGRTAEAVLQPLGGDGQVVCLEPSLTMRAAGMQRVRDARVKWIASLSEANGPFDRILCGAAIWQLEPLRDTIFDLADLLAPGGALCFSIPALYLLEPDEPGGGTDPLLISLPALLVTPSNQVPAGETLPRRAAYQLERSTIHAWLKEAGLRSRSWTFRVRLTQDAYAAWLKIPVVSNGMLPGVTADERARRIDSALDLVDRSSWKWERWRGWTAWKR